MIKNLLFGAAVILAASALGIALVVTGYIVLHRAIFPLGDPGQIQRPHCEQIIREMLDSDGEVRRSALEQWDTECRR